MNKMLNAVTAYVGEGHSVAFSSIIAAVYVQRDSKRCSLYLQRLLIIHLPRKHKSLFRCTENMIVELHFCNLLTKCPDSQTANVLYVRYTSAA